MTVFQKNKRLQSVKHSKSSWKFFSSTEHCRFLTY